MNLHTLVSVLRKRRQLRAHTRWFPAEVAEYQARALVALRAHALQRSPFYAALHRGREDAPLAELPVVTKSMLMERFDDVVTDRAVRYADVLAFLKTDDGSRRFRDRYQVIATSGSTGRHGVFLADPDEWTTMMASYARAQEWAGVAAGLTHKVKMAVVSSRTPWHASARVGATAHSRFVPTLRLEASEPLADNVTALNEFQPDCLVGYASMLHMLAAEQLAGRLRICPRGVMSASEVLTPETRRRAAAAWGSEPFDTYVATESAGIASECAHHRKHLYEDLVIVEPVDEDHRPVPAGIAGATLLVTVLFSRTLPLIRYEISDRVALSAGRCDCGIGLALIDRVEGRREEILALPAAGGGTVDVHPNTFHAVLELVPARAWQVIGGPGGVRVLLESPVGGDASGLERAVTEALTRRGVAALPVRVEAVDRIPRTALGKAPLVRRG